MKQIILILSFILITTGFSFGQKTSAKSGQSDTQTVKEVQVQKAITAKIYIKQGMEDEFIKSARWIIDNTLKEQGCLEYRLYQDPYNKSNFFFFEKYKDQAAIDVHFGAPYFKEFGTKVGEMTSQPTEIKIYNISESK